MIKSFLKWLLYVSGLLLCISIFLFLKPNDIVLNTNLPDFLKFFISALFYIVVGIIMMICSLMLLKGDLDD